MEVKRYPQDIVQLLGVNNIEIDLQEGTLYIEKEKNDGVFVDIPPAKAREVWRKGGEIEIDLNTHELFHLLDEYTEMDFGTEEIYGVKNDVPDR